MNKSKHTFMSENSNGNKLMKTQYVTAIISLALLTGCASSGPHQRVGAGAGAVAGGVLGGIIGNNVGDGRNDVLGAVIGAAVGSYLGDAYGRREDDIDNRINAATYAANTVVIDVQNSNGSYTPVTFTKSGASYVGPRGEYYTSLPTQEQLRRIYGF